MTFFETRLNKVGEKVLTGAGMALLEYFAFEF